MSRVEIRLVRFVAEKARDELWEVFTPEGDAGHVDHVHRDDTVTVTTRFGTGRYPLDRVTTFLQKGRDLS